MARKIFINNCRIVEAKIQAGEYMCTNQNIKDDVSVGKIKQAYGLEEEFAHYPQKAEQFLTGLSTVFSIPLICQEYSGTTYNLKKLYEIADKFIHRMNFAFSNEQNNSFSQYIFISDLQELFKLAEFESNNKYLSDHLENQLKELYSQSDFFFKHFQIYILEPLRKCILDTCIVNKTKAVLALNEAGYPLIKEVQGLTHALVEKIIAEQPKKIDSEEKAILPVGIPPEIIARYETEAKGLSTGKRKQLIAYLRWEQKKNLFDIATELGLSTREGNLNNVYKYIKAGKGIAKELELPELKRSV